MALALAACGAGPGGAAAAGSPERPDGLEFWTVTRVTDGDSLEVAAGGAVLDVRLVGVNATERGECFSDAARDRLGEMVAEREVGLERSGIDQYGRVLAGVWLGDSLVNFDMVAGGMALAQSADDSNPYSELLLAAEEAAYADGRGLWADDACGSPPAITSISIDLDRSTVDPGGPDDERLDEEAIVIVNHGDEPVDVSGWTLRDESSRNRLVFPDGIAISPGGTLEVASGCAGVPGWCADTPIWNNDGDMALLLDERGNVVARARY